MTLVATDRTQPTLFISHGGPNIVTDDTPARDHLVNLAATLPKRPSAIVIASAHFETTGPSVVFDASPEMIYDFGGFAPELYEMVYSAPGEPDLAARVLELLRQNGFAPRQLEKRGYDHGTWTAMKLAFPEADIPIVQVSIDPGESATYHYRLGLALAPLSSENVLIVGSGHITHNLRAVFSAMRGGIAPDPAMEASVLSFTDWIAQVLESGNTDALLDWKNRAPYPAENHPTDEHLMPLFFAAGAAGERPVAKRIHASRQFGFFAFDCYRFDQWAAQ